MGEIAYPSVRVAFGLTTSHELWWWPAQQIRFECIRGGSRRPFVAARSSGTLVLSGAVSRTYPLRALRQPLPAVIAPAPTLIS